MFKVTLTNEGDPRSPWGGKFETIQMAQAWIDLQTGKGDPGKNSAVVLIEDLSLDMAYIEKVAEGKRAYEYPSADEVLGVLMDFGMESPEWLALKSKRKAIQDKYPKPIK